MDPAQAPAAIEFGRYRVLPHRREFLAEGRPVKLGGRAFDVLMVLIEASGAVVSKDALMERVWPGRIVEENNLQAQIAALRAVLGAERDLIRTVSGRGYQFTGEIRVLSASPERAGTRVAAAEPGAGRPPTNIPEPVSELVGREAAVEEVLRLADAHRLVTLTGAGGIGKTTLALALARELRPHFADGVWLAEFSALADPGLVPATVAAAVGLELGGGEASVQRVTQALAGRRLLLVLDTCEHVIESAAAVAEAALGTGSALHIIATSREPLRAGGEWIYPVPPLAVPAADPPVDEDLSQYGAIRLFIERARAAEPHFAPDRRLMATTIASICRRLDGIPLAIELAAARASALGIEELAARLEDRFGLLTGGRRTALPRHQTLRATLDWSHALLPESERVILRRLAAFAGSFSLRAAGAVAASPELVPSQIIDGLSSLVAKSLVTAELGGQFTRYRLLDMTRAYAVEKLGESGERETLARRHAEYYRDVFERAEAEWNTRPTAEWLADYGPRIDNLRVALDWAFSPGGDVSLGVALTAAAVPLWMQLSLLEECRDRTEQALAALANGADRDTHREMQLHAGLGAALMITRGAAAPETGAALTTALEIAESLGNAEFQIRTLWGVWSFHLNSGQSRIALTLAERFRTLAAEARNPIDQLVGERMIGVSQHLLGNQLSARRHIENFLTHHVTRDRRFVTRFGVDQQVTARAFFARILWLQGFPDQAMRATESSIEDAQVTYHATSLCYALAHTACLIALFIGDMAAAEHYVAMLIDYSTKHALARWRAFGRSYQGVLVTKRGDGVTGLRLLCTGLDELGDARSALRFLIFVEVVNALGRAGEIAEKLAVVEEAIQRAESTQERWAIAELLRLKGELLLQSGSARATAGAGTHFRQALDWAHRQGALSWELRAATSLAGLRRDQGRPEEGMALLQPVYDRFTEGFATVDLKAAKALLDELHN